ncbi:carboxylesterase family protein [Clostridium estertheticum]|uniref:carboxylesterase family protein n=1 Tax=Clostridium estertheticum TaxID=238834 RepID=UPI001CF4405A|nr:carboxylesterase family protein [Clostridium estertheticum]MCB2353021.1 carboxylesterase family protein [Clostridium estertheticum]WAG40318.1 carboxylesterase family protein [Clostridium estertheticum]
MSNINKKFSNVDEWLSVSYGKAERFQKAKKVPFDPSQPYDKKGPVSIQMADASWVKSDRGFSEDCLNLNIWAPVGRKEPLPVVVYIHGGGWTYGGNTDDTSDMSGLVSSGKVIGVSINYRLGALGWLSLSQYGGALKDATNLGMTDIVIALEWIHENIDKFGGDSNQVTLTGHSAGAYNSLALLAVPETKGLFQRIAAFSGFVSRYIPRWWAEEFAHKTLKKLNIENPEDLLTIDAKLLEKTVEGLLPGDPILKHGIDNINIGMVDDHELENGVFSVNPQEVIDSGERKDVDILISSTTGEVDWYVLNMRKRFDPGSTEAIVDEMVENSHVARSQAEKILAFHNKESLEPVEIRGSLYTSFNFTLPATRATLAHAKAGGRAYQLNIGPAEGAPAVHGTEMYGIVGQVKPNASQEQIERDRFVTETVLNMATGNYENLWTPVSDKIEIKDIGQRPYVSNTYAKKILELFDGVDRT